MGIIYPTRRTLTPKEIAYYKDVADFAISEPLDDKVADKIETMAVGDINKGKPKRTRKDFKSQEEYDYYRAVLYETASRAEKGLDW